MPASDREYPSVWAKPARKERSTLSRDQIVRQALDLLDSEGIEALSMRKLAARLESGTTSLYWHVANRDELLELVVNEIYGELDAPDPAEGVDWRTATRRFAVSMRSAALRHPWTISVLEHLVAAYPGPNLNAAVERMLGVLESGGFDLPEAERALGTVSAYVTGIAMGEVAMQNRLARHGQTQEEWLADAVRITEEDTHEHERLDAIVAGYAGQDPQTVMDDDFDYGLDLILDGLRSRLDPGS